MYTKGNANDEGMCPYSSDTEALRHGDQTGLGTLVVHAINDEYLAKNVIIFCCSKRENTPLGNYDRKIKT